MAKKLALVTGAAGQDGSYMCELLLNLGYEVHALVRSTDPKRLTNLLPSMNDRNFVLIEGDLLDPFIIRDAALAKFDEVYHFAAQSHVGHSFNIPNYTFAVNATATINLLNEFLDNSPKTRIYFAGSSEMFPHITTGDEHNPLGANSPYAASKVAAFLMGKVNREAYGQFFVGGIAFNHESPRRPETFVTQKIVRGLIRYKQRGIKLQLGNLDARRDWHDARDTVRGIYLVTTHDTPDDWVFASGQDFSIRQFLDIAAEVINVSVEDAIEIDASLIRPKDVDFLRGDPSMVENLGWERQYSLMDTVESMVGHALDVMA